MPRVGKFYVYLMPIQSVFQQQPVKTWACTHLPSSVSLVVWWRVNVHVCNMEINLQVASTAASHNCFYVLGGADSIVNSGEPRATLLCDGILQKHPGVSQAWLVWGPLCAWNNAFPSSPEQSALMGRVRVSWFEDTLKARSFPETRIRNASGAFRWKTHPLYANYAVQRITRLFKGEEYFRICVSETWRLETSKKLL